MARYTKFLSSMVILSSLLATTHGHDGGLRGATHEAAPRHLSDASDMSCGDDMSVRVEPPWVNMDARVDGASSVSSCEQCAQFLEDEGYLMRGWECYSWWWRIYLKRPQDMGLTPVKPLQSFKIADVESAGPMTPADSSFPAALRGVFWLSGQKDSSALTTFAPNDQADCSWCSYGKLILNRYLVRVMGDRVWAFATADSAGYDLANGLSLVYDFSFDSATNPTFATIYPIVTELGNFGARLSTQTWLLNFDMSLLSSEESEALGFGSSVVWVRKSYAFGVEITSSRYYLVQVVDEKGQRIEPAWSKFFEYQTSDEAGSQPGEIFYHGDA
jgi:hypothetical protein